MKLGRKMGEMLSRFEGGRGLAIYKLTDKRVIASKVLVGLAMAAGFG